MAINGQLCTYFNCWGLDSNSESLGFFPLLFHRDSESKEEDFPEFLPHSLVSQSCAPDWASGVLAEAKYPSFCLNPDTDFRA